MTDRITTRRLIAADLGGAAGTVLSGTATSAVLGGQVGIDRNSDRLRSLGIKFPGSAGADEQRVIAKWNPLTGEASWAGARSVVDPTGEDYEVYPAGIQVAQLNEAVDYVLAREREIVENIIPLAEPTKHLYRLELPWVRNRADVIDVNQRASPCLIDNEEFEQWRLGPTAAPTSFVLSGTNATVARVADVGRHGRFAARLTRVGVNARLTQAVGLLDDYLLGKPVVARLGGVTTTAAALRVGIADGVSETLSGFHTGGGGYEDLTVIKTISPLASKLEVFVEMAVNGSADVDRLLAQQHPSAIDRQLALHGSAGFLRVPFDAVARDGGGSVYLEPREGAAPGTQLIIITTQPWAPALTDTQVLGIDQDGLRFAATARLLSQVRPNQNRALLDRQAATASVLAAEIFAPKRRHIALPVQTPPVEVRGA